MNHIEYTKSVVGSVAATNEATTALLRLDTLGYDYASVDVVYAATPAAGTNSSVASVLTLKHSDSASTGYDTISGYPTVAVPTAVASSSAASVIRFDVDMRGRKRYLEVASSPRTNATVTVVARLGKGEEGPATAAAKGVAVQYAG